MPQNRQREFESAHLHAQAKAARLQAIQCQLALGSTLCELAETEIRLGEFATAKKVVGRVRHSAETIGFHLDEPEHLPETNIDLRGHLTQLETRLKEIEARLAQLAQLENTFTKRGRL
jgi:phage shock protein A